MNMENIKDMGNVNGVNMRKGMAIDRRNEQLRRGGATMKSDKMNDGTIVFASYWTTVEMSDRLVAVRFRFPMEFGLLRALTGRKRKYQRRHVGWHCIVECRGTWRLVWDYRFRLLLDYGGDVGQTGGGEVSVSDGVWSATGC
jgi:hypothetical protein